MMAGALDRRITVQAATDVISPTSGEKVPSWADSFETWAAVSHVRADEGFTEDQRRAESVKQFRIRYRAGLSPKTHRVVFDFRPYDIHSITEAERGAGRREALDIVGLARAE